RAARQATLEREIAGALDEARSYYRQDKLPEALAAVARAEALLASGSATDELHLLVQQWRSDLDEVVELERIRLNQVLLRDETLDWPAEPAYTKAFARYGFDAHKPDLDETARRLGAPPTKHARL